MRGIIFLVITLWASSLYAQPFLICDPTTEPVEEYIVKINGVETVSPAQDLGEGEKGINGQTTNHRYP